MPVLLSQRLAKSQPKPEVAKLGLASGNLTTHEVPHLRRVLGLWDLVIFGIVVVTPSAATTVFGLVSVRARGHTVDTILIGMVAIVLTAISYGRMAGLYPAAGSAYTYVGRGLNPHLGFLAGWAMLLDYLTIPFFAVLYGSLILQRMMPGVPYILIAGCFAGGMTYLNVRGIRSTAGTNNVLMVFMSFVLIAFVVLAIRYLLHHAGIGGLFSTQPFYDPSQFHLGAVLHATSFSVLVYIGFDAPTTLAEDVHNPRRNVMLALVIVVLFTGIFGGFVTYLGQLVWPDFHTFQDIPTAFMDVARRVGGVWLFEFMILLLAIANIGAGLVGQVGAARLLFGMGRDGVLPGRFFAHLDPRNTTPTFNILLIGALSFVVALGKRYELIGELQNYGGFLGFVGVNLATIRQFYFLPGGTRQRSFGKDFVAPALGFAICLPILLGLGPTTQLIGGLWMVGGLAYAAVRTRGFRAAPIMIDFSES